MINKTIIIIIIIKTTLGDQKMVLEKGGLRIIKFSEVSF